MQYLCEKQLTAGGVTYYPGEIIPEGVIYPERSGKLSKNGFISELPGNDVATVLESAEPINMVVPVTIIGETTDTCIPLSSEDVSRLFVLLQAPAATAAKMARDLQSADAITVLKAIESRKTVLAALGTVVKDDGTDETGSDNDGSVPEPDGAMGADGTDGAESET